MCLYKQDSEYALGPKYIFIGKIIIVFNYFCKKNSILIFERVLNMCRVLKMSEFSLFVDFLKYDRVLNMDRDVQLWKGFEYSRISNMPGFRIRL